LITRRRFIIGTGGLLGTAALNACGAVEKVAAPTAMTGTSTVEHAAGTTEVPAEPIRVVTTDQIFPVYLISLGLPPAGALNDVDKVLDDVAPLLPDDLEIDSIERIGDRGEPNLESIALISPDFIVGTEVEGTLELYDQLSEMAPTVLIERGANGDWRQRFLALAVAVGRSDQAAEVEANYEQMIAALPDEVRKAIVAFIRPSGEQFRIDSTPAAFAGSVATDAGIPVLIAPEGVGEVAEGGGFVNLSLELLDVVVDADLIVVPDFRSLGVEEASIPQFESNALWETLPAVQARRVIQVPGLVYNGGSHYAAELLLREIERALRG
ncbi:MAG: ABC transporter substrate-binding protein, partial [Chloroflexales bacterium]|nr:ABC transporter substrate-binding protein [Chloroflexales bacterium]